MTKYEREQIYGAIDSLKCYLMNTNKIGIKDQQKLINELIILKTYLLHLEDQAISPLFYI